MAESLPVLPLVVYFVLIPLTLMAAVLIMATAVSNWRRRPSAPPPVIYQQAPPVMAAPQYVQAPPVVAMPGVSCGCGWPLEAAADAVSGQPGVLRCTRPGCGRQAPVGPWAAMGD